MLRPRVISAALAGASVLVLGAAAAEAADLTVTGTRTTPVTTSNANSGPGNVTVDGTINVTGGTAVTVDSSNNLTINGSRVVRSTTLSNGIGVDVVAPLGGISGTITNNGQINVTGTGSNNAVGNHNVGLRIGGTGTFTGNIVTGSSGSIVVGGDDSLGVSVTSRLQGNLGLQGVSVSGKRSTAVSVAGEVTGQVKLEGNVVANGADSVGVGVDGHVGGSIVNGGTITTGTAETTGSDNKINPAVAGRASVLISGQVDGGFVNDRYFVDSSGKRLTDAAADPAKDRLLTGSITAVGGGPAILISPGTSGTANTTIGNVGTGADAFGIINRGVVVAAGGSAGRSVDTIRIVGGNGFTANAGGGISNLGTGSIRAATINASAASVHIGSGGIVPTINNAGRIDARTDRTGGETPGAGGTAYGIRVDAGGDVDTITNSGTIVATANGNNQAAYGIFDAGGLQSITNSGTIRAATEVGDNVQTIAIDTSSNANGLTLANSGTISGSVRLGSGNDVLNMSDGEINGSIAFGAGANQINLSGGTLSGTLTATGGTLAASLSGDGIFDLSGQNGTSLASLNATGNSRIVVAVGTGFTGISVSGAANFSGASSIELNVTDIQTTNQTVDLVTAAGGFSTDHIGTIVNTTNAPFIYEIGDITADATTLSLSLRRKTGAELGLNANYSQLYEASIAALASETGLTGAVNAVRDQAAFDAAILQLAPTTFGSGSARVLVANQDAGFGVLSQRLKTIRQSFTGSGTLGVERPDFGMWVQQTGSFFSHVTTDEDPGYDGSSYGLAIGGDIVLGKNAAVGAGLSYVSSKVDPDGLAKSPLVVGNVALDLYGTLRLGNFFVEGTAGAALNDYKSRRVITFGGLNRTAEADFSGTQLSGNLTVGYEFRTGRFMVIPSTTINALHVKQNDYQEDEAGGLNLAIDNLSFSLVRNTTGLILGYAFPLGDGELRIDAHGAVINRISGDSTLETTGKFVVGGQAFHLETKSAAANGWRAGAAASYVGGRAAFGVGYDREDSKGFENNALTMSLGLHF